MSSDESKGVEKDSSTLRLPEDSGKGTIKELSSDTLDVSVSSGDSPPQKSARSSSSPGLSDTSFDRMSMGEALAPSTFPDVMHKLTSHHYNVKNSTEDLIMGKCKTLYEKDYTCEVVDNNRLSLHYPIGLIVPVAVKENGTEMKESKTNFDKILYADKVKEATDARLRARFVAPVILFDGKYICRSGTLTVRKGVIYEQTTKSQPAPTTYSEETSGYIRAVVDTASHVGTCLRDSVYTLTDCNAMEKIFKMDAEIVNHLEVEHICDLMIEHRKMYKQTISVSSSEKLHMDVYKDVKIENMPYPGCEFFTTYSNADRKPEGLRFDWSVPDVTRELELSTDPSTIFEDMDVTKMEEWDLVKLTKNYLKIMLLYLAEDRGGMLVHCISGWDRTPLFISLLRLSLWADGVIHKSLDTFDMAYLTVAYDWFLFGHNFPSRIEKREEIMHFCFNFLPYIASDEFSIAKIFQRLPDEKKGDRSFPDCSLGRSESLKAVSEYVLKAYDNIVKREEPLKNGKESESSNGPKISEQ